MKLNGWMTLPLAVLVAAGCTESGDVASVVGVDAEASDVRGATKAAESPTIVDVAIAANAETGDFSTLIAAVLAADLAGPLSAVGQRTVFAPTDAAFAAIGLDAAGVAALPKDALRDILLYHVTPGRRYAESVVSATRIRMSSGGFTRISLRDGGAYINDAQIVATDIPASNGIIHVIDGVLLP
jgi:uncharacterized surface protein with fasciclin (FAS1) repeats